MRKHVALSLAALLLLTGMRIESVVSVPNSTSTPLATGASFTGTAESTEGFSAVTVAALTDQDGTLYAEFSPDNSNWDSSIPFTVLAGTNEVHRLTTTRKYFRTRFTNTATQNQSYLRLQTTLGSQQTLNSPLNATIGQDSDALTVRSVSEERATAESLYAGRMLVNKYGSNTDVDAAEDIWNVGGDYTGWPAAADTVTVVSSSASDTSAGTGARTVKIFGLDSNFALQEETLTLNGTTPVATTNLYTRIYRAFVVTAGSGTTNAGTISVRQTNTAANVFLQITAGIGQSQTTSYTVPAGYTGYLIQYQSQLLDTTTNDATIAIKYREFGGAVRMQRSFAIDTSSQYTNQIYGGLRFPEKTDFVFRALSVSNANANISITWDMILVKN